MRPDQVDCREINHPVFEHLRQRSLCGQPCDRFHSGTADSDLNGNKESRTADVVSENGPSQDHTVATGELDHQRGIAASLNCLPPYFSFRMFGYRKSDDELH